MAFQKDGTTKGARRLLLRRLRVDLHPFAVAGIAVAGALLLAWSAATTSYALFRDDVLIEIRQRHSAAERASDDTIAELQAEIRRLTTKHMVERETLGERVDGLIRRQAELGQRQLMLGELAGTAPEPPSKMPSPAPIGGELRLNRAPPDDQTGSLRALDPEMRIGAVERGIQRLAIAQDRALIAVQQRVEEKDRRLRQLHREIGLPVLAPVKAAMGGPFIPLPGLPADSFSERLARLQEQAAATDTMRRAAEALPIGNPAPGAVRTSGFGGRSDPFFHAPAFHSGIDFALPEGALVRASGAGRIVQAGWNGGYGNMVEIDHGRGLVTRYAHLSAITVSEGQRVEPGQRIGLAGSTGRSTGAHLHYETRRNGEAVDPARFIAAGRLLD